MTDRHPLPARDPAPRLTHPLAEALSAEWPMLFQAGHLIDRMIDRAETATETGRER